MIFFEKIKIVLVSFLDHWPEISWKIRSVYNCYFGEKELSFIKQLEPCMSGCVSVDVGANTGVYTYYLSGYSKLVFAFEPLEILSDYWGALGRKNIIYIQSAVGNSFKDVELQAPKVSGKIVHGVTKIKNQNAVSKDTYIQTAKQTKLDMLSDVLTLLQVDRLIIKIDVEGYEENVVNGAEDVIKKYTPVLLIEIEKRHNENYRNVFEFLQGFSYSPYIYSRGKLYGVNGSEECEKQVWGSANKSYINNFIFLSFNSDFHNEILSMFS